MTEKTIKLTTAILVYNETTKNIDSVSSLTFRKPTWQFNTIAAVLSTVERLTGIPQASLMALDPRDFGALHRALLSEE
jgi:hypothetical protein